MLQGVPLRGAYPVIVTFKARREKEQILWRAKEKLRKKDIFVTEDSQVTIRHRRCTKLDCASIMI
jgi:hypothetical protein